MLSFSGKLKIIRFYLRKKVLKNKTTAKDPYAVNSAFEQNIEYWKNLDINTKLFNKDKINNNIEDRSNFATLAIVLGQVWYLNYIQKT
mgnify:CR=1 FL=1